MKYTARFVLSVMKYTAFFVLCVMAVSISASAYAQAPSPLTAGEEKATIALPDSLRADAMVVKWKPDFTYDTVKPGTNGMVCWDRSGFPLRRPSDFECTNTGNLDRVAQNLKAEAVGDRAKSNAMIASEEKDGSRAKMVYGSVWYHALGPDIDHLHMHVTIALPGATMASIGLPQTASKGGGEWLMDAGTSAAHLMTPGD